VPAQRVRTLETLRTSVRENGGKLLIPNLKKLFQSLAQCLADPDHHIPMQALGLLADIAPDCMHDVGNYIPLILVRLNTSTTKLDVNCVRSIAKFLNQSWWTALLLVQHFPPPYTAGGCAHTRPREAVGA